MPTEKSPAKVEEADTMSPTVEVGLMALSPINCQLEPPLPPPPVAACQVPKPDALEVKT